MASPQIPDDDALRAILAAVELLLPSPDRWETTDGYDAVGLAIIDAVWSIGVRYQSVENVMARYRAARLAGGDDPERDRPGDVRRFIDACGGPEEFAQRMGNRQRTSTTNGILKGRGGAARGPHPRGGGRGAPGRPDRRQPGAPGAPAGTVVDRRRPGLGRLLESG